MTLEFYAIDFGKSIHDPQNYRDRNFENFNGSFDLIGEFYD